MTIPTYDLHDGHKIPALGFGTAGIRGREGAAIIADAIGAGYRLIDSAFNYDNEGIVGQAIRDGGVDRSELFITSKLPGRYHEAPLARYAVEESLLRMGLDYVDLYLIHWPNPSKDLYVQAWEGLLEAQRDGLIRSVGVSNFKPHHLARIESATGVLPVVNQVELHPFYPQAPLLEHHAQAGIIAEAWSPLGKGTGVLEEAAVTAAAQAHGVSPAQVLLRWHLQRGALPIPKSGNPQRLRQNLAVFDFELSANEVDAITALGREDGRRFDGDPDYHEEY